ncbi:uncharacterized protein LOC121735045 [Aricia agestis]|uniref:uncharacterized protein LOC121735045 n=1 Tax=Aricia agestis TaxID=91739 RepID=UPI001C208CD3|nr:uncharacterized protein LOC121735045 [Aricia agestis]
MPKRSAQEKIDHYQEKIRRLQSKNKQRKRVCSSDKEQETQDCHQDQTTEEIYTDVNNIHADLVTNGPEAVPDSDPQAPVDDVDPPVPTDPDLDPELLLALGETSSDSPDYGPKILDSQAKLWLPILKRGLSKEPKEILLKQYIIPDNCRLLQAPKINAEISAAIPDMVRNRDKSTLYVQQQQLGAGITATNRAMDLLLLGENKIEALRQLSNGCRLLTDLHYQFTQSRIKLIIPSLDKTCLNVISDAERDETLFGEKLSERIKAAKAIEKQGLQIKRVAPQKPTAGTSQQAGTHRAFHQGNWRAPPRYPSNRGGRGGNRRPAPSAPAPRRYIHPSSNSKKIQANKPRATQQQ